MFLARGIVTKPQTVQTVSPPDISNSDAAVTTDVNKVQYEFVDTQLLEALLFHPEG